LLYLKAVWSPISLTKWSRGVRLTSHRLLLPYTKNSHKSNLILSFVPIGDIFFTAYLADMVRTYKRKTLPPSYSKEDKHGREECEKWLGDII